MSDTLADIREALRAGFDEMRYLETNPDVARGVYRGEIASALDHFLDFGAGEARQCPLRLGRRIPLALVPLLLNSGQLQHAVRAYNDFLSSLRPRPGGYRWPWLQIDNAGIGRSRIGANGASESGPRAKTNAIDVKDLWRTVLAHHHIETGCVSEDDLDALRIAVATYPPDISRRLQLAVAGRPVPLSLSGSLSEARPVRVRPEPIGCIIGKRDSLITGWAFDPDKPDHRVEIALYQSGRLVEEDVADRFVPDLLRCGIGDGCYGFSFWLPEKLRNASFGVFSVRDVVTQADFPVLENGIELPDHRERNGLLRFNQHAATRWIEQNAERLQARSENHLYYEKLFGGPDGAALLQGYVAEATRHTLGGRGGSFPAELSPMLASHIGQKRLRGALWDLIASCHRNGIIPEGWEVRRQRVEVSFRHFIDRVYRSDGKRTIVFVTCKPFYTIARMAMYLRKHGYATFLVIMEPQPPDLMEFFANSFDAMATIGDDPITLACLSELIEPDLFHIQCFMWQYWLARIVIDRKRKAGVVCDFYDVTSLYAPSDLLYCNWPQPQVDLDVQTERYIVRNADAVLSRFPRSIMQRWADRLGGDAIIENFQAYCCDEFCCYSDEKLSDADGVRRVVFCGGVTGEFQPAELFPEKYMSETFRRLLDQGIGVEVIVDPHFDIDRDDPVYRPMVALEQQYPRFHLVRGVTPDKLAALIARYDFGILLTRFDDAVLGITNDQRAGVMATKLYAYLEAGLPIIVNREYRAMAELAENYRVGLAFSSAELDRVAATIARADYRQMAANVKSFNRRFNMSQTIHHLIGIYEQTIARALSVRIQ